MMRQEAKVQQKFVKLALKRSNSQQNYEAIITELQSMVKALLGRVQRQQEQISVLLTQNIRLRRRLDQSKYSQMRQQFNGVYSPELNKKELFTLIPSEHQQSVSWGSKKQAHYELLFGFNQASQSNVVMTPMLHSPTSIRLCYQSQYSIDGLLRAVYAKIMQSGKCIDRLIGIVTNQYQQNNFEELALLPSYPDNGLFGDLVIQFLQKAKNTKKPSLIVSTLNQLTLIDEIIRRILLHKLSTFVELSSPFDSGFMVGCLLGIANVFELELKADPPSYTFFQTLAHLPVEEEISLNPRPRDDLFQEHSIKERLFQVKECQDETGFSCEFIEELEEEESVQASLSSAKRSPRQEPQGFESEICSPMKAKGQHFYEVQSILSLQLQASHQNLIHFQNLRVGSNFKGTESKQQSMLLSSYNNSNQPAAVKVLKPINDKQPRPFLSEANSLKQIQVPILPKRAKREKREIDQKENYPIIFRGE